MLRKIGEIAAISLKHFFDIDPVYLQHAIAVALVILAVLRLFWNKAWFSMIRQWALLKDDYATIKSDILELKEQWESSDAYEQVVDNLKLLKDHLPVKYLFNKH